MKCGKQFLGLQGMLCLLGLQLWRFYFWRMFFYRNLAIKSAIGALLILLGSSANARAQLVFEMPLTPQQFVDEKVKGTADPEVRTYVSAIASIMVIHLLIRR